MTLTYNNNGSPSSKGYLDYIEVNCKRQLTVDKSAFDFRITNNVPTWSKINLQNSNSVQMVWDITDLTNVKSVAFQQNGAALSFIDEIDSILALVVPVDDFFGFIRACYNKRAHNHEYIRLTFALLGVSTPQDLCQYQSSTPFNIGRGIELTGFQLDEALLLMDGLVGICHEPKVVLKEVLVWT